MSFLQKHHRVSKNNINLERSRKDGKRKTFSTFFEDFLLISVALLLSIKMCRSWEKR